MSDAETDSEQGRNRRREGPRHAPATDHAPSPGADLGRGHSETGRHGRGNTGGHSDGQGDAPRLGHNHSHGHGPAAELTLDPRARRRAIRVVLMVLVPVLLATVVGMAALWPSAKDLPEPIPITDPSAAIMSAKVTGPRLADRTMVPARLVEIPAESVQRLQNNGDPVPELGSDIMVYVPNEELAVGVDVGSVLHIVYLPYAIGVDDGSGEEASPYVFFDYDRSSPILILAALYALLVFAVARWRGVAAFVGLGLSVAVLGFFTLPALLAGGPPMPIALVSATAIMLASLYVAHGVSVRTSTALLGTICGLALTTLIGWWSTGAAHLSGMTSEEAMMIPIYVPGLDLRGLVMCGMVLAGLGVLNDVSVTQASAVWEMRALAPTAGRWTIFRGAMRIGRDHIASTVYTIVFAYLGASLPLFMLVLMQQQSVATSLTAGSIAEEVVRTLVSSIGLVLAIPITTAIATALSPGPVHDATDGSGTGPSETDPREMDPREARPHETAPRGPDTREMDPVAQSDPREPGDSSSLSSVEPSGSAESFWDSPRESAARSSPSWSERRASSRGPVLPPGDSASG